MAKGYVTLPIGIRRVDNLPFEHSTLFDDYESAADYAANDVTAYVGQQISVINGNYVYAYIINKLKRLSLIGTQALIFEPELSPKLINHGMGGYPEIKCIGNDGNLITAQVKYIDEDNIEVSWNGEFLGFIVLT